MFPAVAVSVSMLLSVVSQVCGDPVVAFSAFIKGSKTIEKDTVIVFDNVLINNGVGYDSSTGVFTVPKPGAYIFHMHALSKTGGLFSIGLYLNETSIVSEYGAKSDKYSSGGNTAIVPLLKGDRIYLKAEQDTKLFGTASASFATFNGYSI